MLTLLQDLNCIQIVQTWKVFKFRTLMVGIGSMSGSELLNLLFKEKLSVILSDQLPRIAAAVDMTSEEVLQSFVQRFEKAKRTFSGDTTGMLKISFEPVRPIVQGLPRIPELHVGVKFIRISALEIREVFDKVRPEKTCVGRPLVNRTSVHLPPPSTPLLRTLRFSVLC